MDFRERFDHGIEALKTALDGQQTGIWTALPGIIQSVDFEKITCTIQPSIQAIQGTPQGERKHVNLPLLVDVPIHFQSGGGYTGTFPVKAGDEVLVVFASRCIDNWWQEGGVQPQFEQRMHDLSDAFCIPKVWSQKTKITNISSTTAQFRSDDGTRFVEIDTPNKRVKAITDGVSVELDSANGNITMIAPQTIRLQANQITLQAQQNVDVNGQQNVNVNGGSQVNLKAPAINEN